MPPIIKKIYDKMHQFQQEHLILDGIGNPIGNLSPTRLYLNHKHYCDIMMTEHYMQYVQIDFLTGKPETILGMQYQIKDDLIEMEVH